MTVVGRRVKVVHRMTVTRRRATLVRVRQSRDVVQQLCDSRIRRITVVGRRVQS